MATEAECRAALRKIEDHGGVVMLTHDRELGQVFSSPSSGVFIGPTAAVRLLIAGRYLEPQNDGLLADAPQTWKVAR